MIALDTETGGLDPTQNPILEVAFRIFGENRELLATYSTFVKVTDETWKKCDPKALEVNGITREMAEGGKTLEEVAKEVTKLFQELGINKYNAFYFCQNPTFDRGFWSQIFPESVQSENQWPYHWLDLASMYYIEAVKAGGSPKNLSKDAIAKSLGLPPEANPHRALNGVDHMMLIFNKMVS